MGLPWSSRHPATAWVDLDRIGDNFQALKAYAGDRAVIPVVKANAYGHGAVAVSRLLERMGVPLIAVAYVNEAIALRQAGVSVRLLVLTGFAPGQETDLAGLGLTPVLSTIEQLCALETDRSNHPDGKLLVHVKVDTGMARLGLAPADIEPVVRRLQDLDGVEIEGLLTHLASADEDEAVTARQLDVFDHAIVRLDALGVRPRLIHAANSAGMAFTRDTHTAVRPGLLLYGLSPRPLSPKVRVQPAMEMRARVAALRVIPKGASVSYGGRFVASRETRVATINAGYADGIPRTDLMRERGTVRHGATPLKVIGTVCMDLTTVDATDTRSLTEGDEVTLFGEAPTAWDVATWAGTNAWQILAAVGARVPRRYRLGGQVVNEDLSPQD